MGHGRWTRETFATYACANGREVTERGDLKGTYSPQDIFQSRKIAPELDPKNVMRECCDSEEHPKTIPVILALDVTGSMGGAAVEVAKKLNIVMTGLYEQVSDVEFLIMGIGDLAYDNAPIQASQFESDIRIAEQLDKVYFEAGGGGNTFESYTGAWYFGLYHTKLDCWARGEKGIIITMGDEPLNPYLPCQPLSRVTGDSLQADIETTKLYPAVKEKFELYHLAVNDQQTAFCRYKDEIFSTFGKYLDKQHLREVGIESIADAIIEIVTSSVKEEKPKTKSFFSKMGGLISW